MHQLLRIFWKGIPMNTQQPNHLSRETSPYLLQHAHNPVEWYPWREEALERARREDKPILLSIGYSACHWCHVMAHESFEDRATARVMNELYVNIKVDREERPDLDKIYQLSHQLLTRRPGGWPLNVLLTPHNHVPFFSGTYFPKEPRYNMPPFVEVLEKAAAYYASHKQALEQHSANFLEAMRSIAAPPESPENALDEAILHQARQEIGGSFDAESGGFGQAPKFPHPPNLEFLLRYWAMAGRSDLSALHMAIKTLEKMAEGGLYDQLGGGFCRYSVDAFWLIPHFEKMLYDNGPLLALYAQAYQIAENPLFKTVALESAAWTMREMQSPEGGYYSSLDADSEGVEGKFYAWDRDEIESLLSPDEFAVAKLHYGLDQTPNFEGKWHLHIAQPLPEVAKALNLELSQSQNRLQSARQKLFQAREKRVHPGRDEKILTSWNALMIKGMTMAGRVFERRDFIDSAQKAYDFLRRTLWQNGRLLATYKDGKAHLNAYLDDYAYLIDASLELLQTRWRTDDLLWAKQLADVLLEHFEDKENGGFFFTSDDHEALLHRPKPFLDESTPAGNGVAAYALQRLGLLLGETRYTEAAAKAIQAAASSLRRMPQAHCTLLIALEEALNPPKLAIIRGDSEDMQAWQKQLQRPYAPRRLCFSIPAGVSDLPGMLAERKAASGTIAYVCTETTCLPPIQTLDDLEQALR